MFFLAGSLLTTSSIIACHKAAPAALAAPASVRKQRGNELRQPKRRGYVPLLGTQDKTRPRRRFGQRRERRRRGTACRGNHCCRAGVSGEAGAVDRSHLAGRQYRFLCPQARTQARAASGAAGHCGKLRWRRHHHRQRVGGARGAERLHAAHGNQLDRDHPVSQSKRAVRCPEGLHAGFTRSYRCRICSLHIRRFPRAT